MAPKRPHHTLTLKEKCDILNTIEKGGGVREIARKFNIPKSTVYDIKMNRKKIQNYVSRTFHGVGKRKVMRKSENPKVEKALYTWFLQQRDNHVPISSEILRAKAKYFYKQLTGKEDFLASSGWLDKFKIRHGIRFLKVCGERISNDTNAVKPFQDQFLKIINEMELTEDQVYNADESAAFWRVLPNQTWVHQEEKSAPGRKISKDRVTFMPCCNASGTHKLPLLVIGKAKNPRAFKNIDLPVTYEATNRGWMTQLLFLNWFKNQFIRSVTTFLENSNRPIKALLLLDNAPSHPPATELNFNPNFRVLFLPPNCTALIQPMDQNLIQNIKVSYRKSLLNYIISSEGNNDVGQLLKAFNLKEAVFGLNKAWESISEKNIKQSWSVLWPKLGAHWEEEDDLPLSYIRKQELTEGVNADLNVIKESLKTLNPREKLADENIEKWALGLEEHPNELADSEITGETEEHENSDISDEEESGDIREKFANKITNNGAINAFDICIQWAEENKVEIQDLLLLKKLQDFARARHIKSATTQSKITSFFQ